MRQLIIGALCSAAILAIAGCNKSPRNEASEAMNATGNVVPTANAYYTIKADDIANPKLTALSGTFEMLAATAATGIQSSGSGGACLVFTAKDLGFTTMDGQKCSTNNDCSKPATSSDKYQGIYAPDPAHPDHFENRYGYCDTKNNQCWSKPINTPATASAPEPPEPPVCNRPIITMTAGTVNAVPKTPPGPGPGAMPVDVSKWVKQGAKARVVACLNGPKPWSTGKAPCAEVVSVNRIEVMGKPATLHN